MISFKEHYVVDETGKRVGVLLDIKDYQKLLEELEELESIRAYDAAKASGDEAIPFEEAIAEIEQDQRPGRFTKDKGTG
jgi:PHD/YefM family antitoxin component YafN of YafNO toxin-antitoxin module